ncbi:hypothetical protein MGYG_04607 [Nannizzia gypsea CBS 118893]|uniref:Uncharacterized protein n=1 Tax=Arthroderma gypseum (strain ATCC MYA-4604 / CBS 118893) TaxID=535722 RepID=E4UU14_ARTGP|nr:hypothetical protein MGYG_04607 [Nannizzia gypsea CBS 118893]EFR01604.1 hypothetical protein MGYG_04607 [Nannizzia gypsea CBS 118893]
MPGTGYKRVINNGAPQPSKDKKIRTIGEREEFLLVSRRPARVLESLASVTRPHLRAISEKGNISTETQKHRNTEKARKCAKRMEYRKGYRALRRMRERDSERKRGRETSLDALAESVPQEAPAGSNKPS